MGKIMEIRGINTLILLFLALLCVVTSLADDTDYLRITQLRESKDALGLEEMIRNRSNVWSQLGKEEYGGLMAHALKSWNSISNEMDNEATRKSMQEYAKEILSSYNSAETNSISIETEFDLVCFLYEEYTYSKGQRTDQEWSKYRREGAEAFLHAWQRFEKALSEDIELNDLPEENVDIPDGVSGFPGMSPELIKDPARRAEYEKAIEENEKKIDAYNRRISLQNKTEWYSRLVRRYLVSTYAIAPHDSHELKDLLKAYVKNPDTRLDFIEEGAM